MDAARWRRARTSICCFCCASGNRAGGRGGRRGHALPAVGPQAEGRPRHPHGRGMPEAGQGGHDDPHHPARMPFHARRSEPCSTSLLARFDHEVVRNTAPEFVAAKLAERDERIQRAGASRYLVEPNVKEGKGGLARSQHLVLDREIRLSRAGRRGAGRRRPVQRAGIAAVSPLRDFSVESPLHPAFPDRPRRGAAEFRFAAPDRGQARLCRRATACRRSSAS